MRAKYLAALEADRFDELPGRTYARAFLRTYASALGLEADRFVAEFDEQQPEPEEEEAIPEFRPRRPLRMPLAVPAFALFAIVAILGWSAWTGERGPNTTVGPSAPAPAAAAVTPSVKKKQPVVHRVARVLVVKAVGGPCWIEARRDSSNGELLAQRTLADGESATFVAPRVWVRLGAPWNAVVQRGARTLRLPAVHAPLNVAY
jgi:hypothetical protein